jgi:two-component system chemotaxis response regulator CheY
MLKRILIADDSRVVREAVCSLFASAGFTVCGEAEDGRQALEEAKQLRPDLIVLDFSMPVMNGIEAAKALKQILPDVPIILYTAHAGGILEEEAFAAGIASVVSKNRDISDLVAEAQALLGVRRRLRRIFQIAYTQSLVFERAELLNARGYEVRSALGNEAAMTELKACTEGYDLFIVGHAAPLEVRAEMVQWLKQHYPTVKILAVHPPQCPQLPVADYNAGLEELLVAVATATA